MLLDKPDQRRRVRLRITAKVLWTIECLALPAGFLLFGRQLQQWSHPEYVLIPVVVVMAVTFMTLWHVRN